MHFYWFSNSHIVFHEHGWIRLFHHLKGEIPYAQANLSSKHLIIRYTLQKYVQEILMFCYKEC